MQKPIIAVDCDGVMIDMIPHWLEWCNKVTGKNIQQTGALKLNNISSLFPEIDALDFWRQNYLYDSLQPMEGAIDALERLSESCEIGFVTYAKAGHFPSKCRWLKKIFPNYAFINATKEKGYTRCDFAIDDRHNFLNQYPGSVTTIKMHTPYMQEEALIKDTYTAHSWDDIKEYILEELYERGR